jgi:ATP-dependent DNA ligase
MEKTQMRLLALERIYAECPKEEWLQVKTDGSFSADCVIIGAGEFCGLRSIYAPVGQVGSTFDG